MTLWLLANASKDNFYLIFSHPVMILPLVVEPGGPLTSSGKDRNNLLEQPKKNKKVADDSFVAIGTDSPYAWA